MARGLRNGTVIAAVAALGMGPMPDPGELPPATLLLLAAPWCAPCWQELARLDELAAAGAPLTVRVFVMEDGPRARAMLAGLPVDRRWQPTPASSAAVRAALWARTPGLPFSLATDREGRICAEHGGGLTVASAHALQQSCAVSQSDRR